ncbi:ankyrin [Leucogyrophana mollusca]|uniref:Ankyrin n=1 Tax=Leucogyrophana mollusca TaxID=85980 RepID=A0ACB8BLX4_9AGAM|nr:ankyrin [Leucogyrophana mollusca]
MSRVLVQRSFENFALLQAASEGNLSGVQDALKSGADINASDHSGRTVLTCALTADRWETIDASDASFMSKDRLDVLRLVVSHPDISLYTLNAPQDSINDVTPLGMAAWLDMPPAVDALLECSAGAVSVDGMDTDGATPLMYAARDGRLEVVQQLLAHAARPDSRDRNHRSSVQFALPHPRVLWSCEYALRCHRWRESEMGNKRGLTPHSGLNISQISPYISASSPSFPTSAMFSPQITSRLTDSIVQAVLASDIPVLYSLLFPSSPPCSAIEPQPVVVNLPDPEGWSAIHYCVSVQRPSIEVLDALYRAGADVSLFTAVEDYTPLHCLAHLARVVDNLPESTQSLYQFIVHLIRDLRAPLSARDKDDETCMHIAAEHGECIEVLVAFLDCDTTGAVQNLRNSRGLTPLEVAKPHFRAAFGEVFRPQSSLSDRTIRPATSLASITSFSGWASPAPSAATRETATHLPHDFDVTSLSERLLDNFHHVSKELQFARDPAELDGFQRLLKNASQTGDDVLAHFRSQCDEAAKELRDMREVLNDVDRLWNNISHDVEEQVKSYPGGRCVGFCLGRMRLPRGSEDSQTTAVEIEVDAKHSPKEVIPVEFKDVAVLTDCLPPLSFETTSTAGARTVPWPEWLDSFILSADSTTYKAHLANLIEIEREIMSREAISSLEDKIPSKETKLKSLLKSRKRYEKVEKSGASKLKAWLKKKIVAEKPLRLQITYDLEDRSCAVGREVKDDLVRISFGTDDCQKPLTGASQLEHLQCEAHSSPVVLAAASRDLSGIDECLHGVDHLISTACHSISRAERIIKRTVKTREASIEKLRLRHIPVYDDIFAFSPDKIHASAFSGVVSCSGYLSPPSSNVSSRSSSAQSSTVSLASTLREDEDEDSRVLRRLLLRKIGARVDGAFDEIDRANIWLRIVKEVLRDLKNRTFL